MPVDVNSTKLSAEEVKILNKLQQLIGKLNKELHGLNDIMPDEEFIRRADYILDMMKEIKDDYQPQIKEWKKQVEKQ